MRGVSIITIGDELLIGQVVDTNSAFMAAMLRENGFTLNRRVAIGDEKNAIIHALDEELKISDAVIFTGGLGPTSDDITKDVLNEYFGAKLILNERALATIHEIFNLKKRPITERNIMQAMLPDVCEPIYNDNGTAPGMLFRKDGKMIFSLPGVPSEMMAMMNDVIAKLKFNFQTKELHMKTLITFGIGESFIADKLVDFEAEISGKLSLAYLPNYSLVRLRLSGEDESFLEEKFSALAKILEEHIIALKDVTVPSLIFELLQSQNKTVAIVESCTGGNIAHQLTLIPGASQVFAGGIVSYTNSVKHELLGVDIETLKLHTAVSEQVCAEMLQGVLSRITADYAIAITGYVGLEGNGNIPGGTVFIATGTASSHIVKKYSLRNSRAKNIEVATTLAFLQLRQNIVSQ